MDTQTTKLYASTYTEARTYLLAAAFIIGNILLPQLCHIVPNGGVTWLPIYFFTLVGAYKYGWRVGLVTALLSPAINSVIFGMPHMTMLPVIETKSILLALTAGYASYKFGRITLPLIAAVVIVAQLAGGVFEFGYTGSIYSALQDFRIGLPGILLQIFGSYLLIRYINNK